jgi:hypothetical protein
MLGSQAIAERRERRWTRTAPCWTSTKWKPSEPSTADAGGNGTFAGLQLDRPWAEMACWEEFLNRTELGNIRAPVCVIGQAWLGGQPGGDWADWQATSTSDPLLTCDDERTLRKGVAKRACAADCHVTKVAPAPSRGCCNSPSCTDPRLGRTNICCPRTTCHLWYCYRKAALGPVSCRIAYSYTARRTPSAEGNVCQLTPTSVWICMKGSR